MNLVQSGESISTMTFKLRLASVFANPNCLLGRRIRHQFLVTLLRKEPNASELHDSKFKIIILHSEHSYLLPWPGRGLDVAGDEGPADR